MMQLKLLITQNQDLLTQLLESKDQYVVEQKAYVYAPLPKPKSRRKRGLEHASPPCLWKLLVQEKVWGVLNTNFYVYSKTNFVCYYLFPIV